MISEPDKAKIMELASKHKVSRILLFGSSIDPARESKDIDIAVEGVSPADFFRFYGELIFSLSKPVDLIDLSSDSSFSHLIRKEGLPIYG